MSTNQQKVTNLNGHAVQVRINTEDGKIDCIHLQPKATVKIPVGSSVNENWLATATKIKVHTQEGGE